MSEMIENHLDESLEKTYYNLKKDLNINYISMDSQDVPEYFGIYRLYKYKHNYHNVKNRMKLCF